MLKRALAPMMAAVVTHRPSRLQIKSGYRRNDVESGLTLDAHGLKSE